MKEKERVLIPCPIDNTNLMEDALEDNAELFEDFLPAGEHRDGGKRHLVGFLSVDDEASAYIDAMWCYGGHMVTIKILAVDTMLETFEDSRRMIFDYYKRVFSSWMNEDNRNLVVNFNDDTFVNTLYVSFHYDVTEP